MATMYTCDSQTDRQTDRHTECPNQPVETNKLYIRNSLAALFAAELGIKSKLGRRCSWKPSVIADIGHPVTYHPASCRSHRRSDAVLVRFGINIISDGSILSFLWEIIIHVAASSDWLKCQQRSKSINLFSIHSFDVWHNSTLIHRQLYYWP